jgi:hypothetical protein
LIEEINAEQIDFTSINGMIQRRMKRLWNGRALWIFIGVGCILMIILLIVKALYRE